MSSLLPKTGTAPADALEIEPPVDADEQQESTSNAARTRRVANRAGRQGHGWAPYLLAAPYALVLLGFLVIPILLIVVISFWEYSSFVMTPAFVLDNYKLVFSPVYMKTYLNTFRYAAIVWFFALIIGFPVAYYLAFEIQSDRMRMALFLLCTVPFLTSNIIRNIAWIPFLGRNGILNNSLIAIGLIGQPIDVFLFSDISVVIAMVHLYTLFMVVPIFNTMMRIDHSLIEAARDGGASMFGILREVIVPLSAPGVVIGTIFVVSLVLGNYSTVRLMSGGQSSSAGLAITNMINSLQYPPAAANAVVLLIATLLVVGTLLRFVDVRKEL